jgi:phenylacetate-CoA ligase
MNSSEIFEAASKSRLLKDPYVEKIWGLMNDRSLFSKSPDYLSKIRRTLLRDALSFFSRHSDYYLELFERLSISSKDAELENVGWDCELRDIL